MARWLVVMVMCWAVAATAVQGNCRDECLAGCHGWAIICHLSCNSACLGEVGISAMSTVTPQEDQRPSQQEAAAHSVSMLRDLKPDNTN
uniref:Acidic protein n=1 Tax=Leersia perrieri TaxID=77586 RepID=A0A0D9W1P0_9ORYZ